MPTVRERLDNLTAKLWGSVDDALDQSDPPHANSIAASDAAILASVTAIQAIVDSTAIADLNTQIDAITAIAPAQRTQAQKDMLTLLRIVKSQQQVILPLYREVVDNRRRIKSLQRDHSLVARFAMFLDGGPSRVRQSDIDGDE